MLLGVSGYRAAYRSGVLSPEEVVSSHLAYARRVSEQVNAISAISPTALDEARLSTKRWREGGPIGPLDGIPVVVKDSYCIEGMPRWHGSAIHDGDSASVLSSEPILRLREAGAIVVAKTTMPDMGMLASGISSQFGIVRNPWDKEMSPGGSSAGAAASLAAGLGAFALGTDIAGSVRLPACQCGLAAIKPTQGRIAYSPASTMRSSGVLARTVADVIEGLCVVGCEAPSDPWCLPGRFFPMAFEQAAQRLPHVGVVLDMGYGTRPDAAVCEAVEAAAKRLEAESFLVESLNLDLADSDFDNADLVFKAHALAEVRSSRDPGAVLPQVREWISGSDHLVMADYEDALGGLLSTVSHIEQKLKDYDFLLCPVVPVAGFPADSPGPGDESQLLHHTQFAAWWNQTCRPAAVYRETTDPASGLPIGVQIVGRRFDDAAVLALAQRLEATRDSVPGFPMFTGVPDYAI